MFKITLDPNSIRSIVELCEVIGDPRRYAGESWDLDKIEAMITEYHKISSHLIDAEDDLIECRDRMIMASGNLASCKARTIES